MSRFDAWDLLMCDTMKRGYIQHVTTQDGIHFCTIEKMLAFMMDHLQQPTQDLSADTGLRSVDRVEESSNARVESSQEHPIAEARWIDLIVRQQRHQTGVLTNVEGTRMHRAMNDQP